MLERIAGTAAAIKRDLARKYAGSAHIQEAIPSVSSGRFPVGERRLRMLHDFAENNPIYFNSFEQDLAGVPCTVYEGDINEYWLGSIKHGSSCQPFYPTWIISAFVLAAVADGMGLREIVDIGSGDGRIAFCGGVMGMRPHSIEVDGALVGLQETICRGTGQDVNPECRDALEYDYSGLRLTRPALVVGGLPQMGGEILAAGVADGVAGSVPSPAADACLVLAGTHSRGRPAAGGPGPDPDEAGGWGAFVKGRGLRVVRTVCLPTVWTFDQRVDTPYVYARFR